MARLFMLITLLLYWILIKNLSFIVTSPKTSASSNLA